MPEFCKLRRVANRAVRRLLGPGALARAASRLLYRHPPIAERVRVLTVGSAAFLFPRMDSRLGATVVCISKSRPIIIAIHEVRHCAGTLHQQRSETRIAAFCDAAQLCLSAARSFPWRQA
jgi:hypothetical protein